MSIAQALITYAQSGGRDISPVVGALSAEHRRRASARRDDSSPLSQPSTTHHPQAGFGGSGKPGGYSGKTYVLPTGWSGTHVTDGLGWNTRTAEDIMLAAGTPVGAPEAGTVLYFHPNGAQGGGSELFDPDAPGRHNYWIGHVDAGRVGHVPRGGYIARVSSRHPRPHVHIDRGLQ